MAYNKVLADRIEQALGARDDLVVKKMFGGIGFMVNGNMCCGVLGDEMIARVAPDETDAALHKPGTRSFALGGRRPMTGWVLVAADACKTDAALKAWVRQSLTYASALPAKSK